MAFNSSFVPDKPSDPELLILFLLDSEMPFSNANIGKILERSSTAISRDLKSLLDRTLVHKTTQGNYTISPDGHEMIERVTENSPKKQELRVAMGRLRNRTDLPITAITIIAALLGISGWSAKSAAAAMPMASTATTASSASIISKPVLVAIILSVAVAGGAGTYYADAIYSDPEITYSVYPAQLPADLHGTDLSITGVYSTDDKSEIVDYECDNDSIVRGLSHTFECVTTNSFGNTETVTARVDVKPPQDYLEKDVSRCIENNLSSIVGAEKEFPYLLTLAAQSPSSLKDLRKTHVLLMDQSYEDREFEAAKRHATILLKYFDAHDIQALSTLGNAIRDHNRNDNENIECAISIHQTPKVLNHVWGKISLAEDHHANGNYDRTVDLTSLVTDAYYPDNPEIEITSYMNALIVKANAQYRIALFDKQGFSESRANYDMAHDIRESYDTWFGLGNIDRQEGNCEHAIVKYTQARELARDTDDVDEALLECGIVR